MNYIIDLKGCLKEKSDQEAFSRYQNSIISFLNEVQQEIANHQIPALEAVYGRGDLSHVREHAHQMRNAFKDILILGVGGSSWGGQTFCALSDGLQPRLHFLDNIDFLTFRRILSQLSLAETGVLVISKSGKTAETLMQCLTLLQLWQQSMPREALRNHFTLVTEPQDNLLSAIGKKYHLPIFDHPLDIGGRFSCFTIVSILPGLIVGLDADALREGGLDCLMQHYQDLTAPAYQGAALTVFLANQGKSLPVFMAFRDPGRFLGAWYRQLLAESLGKGGQGYTPIYSHCVPDLHSQLQLYLDGPKDKFFTLLATENNKDNEVIIHDNDVPHMLGQSMDKLLKAEQEATIRSLIEQNCPVRVIRCSKMNEKTLGSLFMHFMIETITMAKILKVNAFDQPAVERLKIITGEYLHENS